MPHSWDVFLIQHFLFSLKIKHKQMLVLTLKSDSTRGPCGSKTRPVRSSVTAKFFYTLLQHTLLPAKTITLKTGSGQRQPLLTYECKQNKLFILMLMPVNLCLHSRLQIITKKETEGFV